MHLATAAHASALLPMQSGSDAFQIPHTLNGWLGFLAPYIRGAINFVVAFAIVYLLGRWILVPAVNRVLERQGFDRSIQSLADNITGIAVWVLALAMGLMAVGFNGFVAAFGLFASAIALAVGFASQDILENFVAGIFILKDKPFEVGDWIEVEEISGKVEDIDLRVSRIRTFNNERITVPNSELANNPLTNPVAYDTLRQSFTFGIGYDDDIAYAKEVILDEAAQNSDILDDPATSIRVTELGDSSVGLETRFWIEDPTRSDYKRVQSDLVEAVKNRLDAEGIDMPYPYRQLTGSVNIDGELETQRTEASADD